MAQTIQQYQQQITDAYVANAALVGVTIDPTKWSYVCIDRCFIHAIAVVCWSIATLFDLFTADVNEIIASKEPHTLEWYSNIATTFQYGFDLVPGKDYYDNTGIDDATIAASKVIAYAKAIEQDRGLRIKVASLQGGVLAPVPDAAFAAFSTINTGFMARVKDAGVKLFITTGNSDNLLAAIRIKYNPLIINSLGARIDGTTTTPVQDAIHTFLLTLSTDDFNGIFSVQAFAEAIKAVDGVEDLSIDSIQARYGELPFTSIDIEYTADAGYLTIADADLTLTFIAA